MFLFWRAVNLQMNRTVKYQGAFSRIVGLAGKRFLFSPPPPPSTKSKKKKKNEWRGRGRGKKTFAQLPNFMPRGSLALPDFPGLFKFRIENGFQNWRPEKVKQKSLRGVETILGTLSKDDERRGRGRSGSNFELKHVSTHVRFCPRWRHSSSTQRGERGKACFDVVCRT